MTCRNIRTAIVTLVVALSTCLALAGTASAKVIFQQESSFSVGSGLAWVAVDNSAGPHSGGLYIGVVDEGTFASSVYQATSDGTPTSVELNGSETPAGFFSFLDFATFKGAGGPAVDSSTGANAGDIYVPDIHNGVVDRFNEDGIYDCQITGKATPSASECAGATGSETPTGSVKPLSVAVDPTSGDVAVGDESGVLYRFNQAGEYLGEVADANIVEPGSLAFDSAANLYVVNANSAYFFYPGGNGVKFDSAGIFEYVVTANTRQAVGVDTGTDRVYFGGFSGGPVEAFSSTGSPVSTFGGGAVAVDANAASGQVYLTTPLGTGQIWTPLFVPNVTTGEATDVEEQAATLHGEVDPDTAEGGSQVESCEFKYGTTAGYGQSAQCSPTTPYSGATEVSADVAGLSPSTTYHYRLVAENEEGQEGQGEDRAFTTRGHPMINGERSIARTSSATVKAQIDPFGYETTCEVEYVDDASFQAASGYEGAASAPCEEAIPAGFGAQPASAKLSGLTIGTLYHYRFVAHNAATSEGGTTVGEDRTFSTFGIEDYAVELLDDKGKPYTQAGGRPHRMRVSFELTTTEPESTRNPESGAANLRTVQVDLPPGLIGDPTATPKCPAYAPTPLLCSPDTQVGAATIFFARGGDAIGQIFNVDPPKGVAAQLGGRFNAFGSVRVDAGVRTGSDYGIRSHSVSITADEGVKRFEMTLWGVPADPSHNGQRLCRETASAGCPSLAPLRPFLTNPTSCTGALTSTLRVDAWQEPGNFVFRDTAMPAIEGCEGLAFRPTIAVQPQVRASESPTGVHVNLHVPQNQSPVALATAHLKDAMVKLPAGVAVNPSGANGLGACTPAQIELNGPNPARCPDAAKIGTVQVHTPLLDHPAPGAVYVAAPHDNPFDSLLAIYVAVDDPESGVVVKLAGKVTPDPQTGQLTTTFSDNPQLPFEDFTLDFFGGPRAPLVTPETCGTFTTTTDLRPWSENGDRHPQSSFGIDSGPNGSACANSPGEQPNDPAFSAGTVSPLAGAYSPFVLHLEREDGSQRLSAVNTVLPEGLVGKLAGVAYCPEAAIEAAKAKSGRDEQASASCPSASEVGRVNVGAGAGPQPYHVQGRAYLAGPYKGAPLSLAIVTPAVAGPFDLGTVVVRTALEVNPETARISAKSDPLPTILEGIPLDIRSVGLEMDRPDFSLNPTSCEATSVAGEAVSVLNQVASLSSRFQVGGCAGLGFKPRLGLRLFGKTHRGAHPALRAVLRARKGDANIGRAVVSLPRSEFLDQGNIRTVCTRVQFAADACPEGSIYGYAVAKSPLLDEPLRGPVYLRSSSNKLPDLVAALSGQIEIDLVGRIDSVKLGGGGTGIRTTFATVPDAPVSKFVLKMQGGSEGLLVNSTNLCAGRFRAVANFDAHSGAIHDTKPPLKSSACRGHGRSNKSGRQRLHHRDRASPSRRGGAG